MLSAAVTANDRWTASLPHHHVGLRGIHAALRSPESASSLLAVETTASTTWFVGGPVTFTLTRVEDDTHYPLAAVLVVGSHGSQAPWTLDITYDASAVEAATARRHADAFVAFLQATASDTAIGAIDVVGPDDDALLLDAESRPEPHHGPAASASAPHRDPGPGGETAHPPLLPDAFAATCARFPPAHRARGRRARGSPGGMDVRAARSAGARSSRRAARPAARPGRSPAGRRGDPAALGTSRRHTPGRPRRRRRRPRRRSRASARSARGDPHRRRGRPRRDGRGDRRPARPGARSDRAPLRARRCRLRRAHVGLHRPTQARRRLASRAGAPAAPPPRRAASRRRDDAASRGARRRLPLRRPLGRPPGDVRRAHRPRPGRGSLPRPLRPRRLRRRPEHRLPRPHADRLVGAARGRRLHPAPPRVCARG